MIHFGRSGLCQPNMPVGDNIANFPINGRSSTFQAHHSLYQCSYDAFIHWLGKIPGGCVGAPPPLMRASAVYVLFVGRP